MWEAIIILSIFVLGVAWALVRINKAPKVMSFREAMDLTELPVVTFRIDDKRVNFLLDTGANASIIDEKAVALLPHKLSEEKGTVMGIEGVEKDAQCVDMELSYKDLNYIETFRVLDMSGVFDAIKQESGVIVNGILGNAFFTKYRYVLDFKDLIAYSKK